MMHLEVVGAVAGTAPVVISRQGPFTQHVPGRTRKIDVVGREPHVAVATPSAATAGRDIAMQAAAAGAEGSYRLISLPAPKDASEV